jgi:hypothetical protein
MSPPKTWRKRRARYRVTPTRLVSPIDLLNPISGALFEIKNKGVKPYTSPKKVNLSRAIDSRVISWARRPGLREVNTSPAEGTLNLRPFATALASLKVVKSHQVAACKWAGPLFC